MAARLSGVDDTRLRNLVEAAGLPVDAPAIPADDWMSAMGMDKKVQGKQLRFVLLRELGDAYVTSDYDASRLAELTGQAA